MLKFLGSEKIGLGQRSSLYFIVTLFIIFLFVFLQNSAKSEEENEEISYPDKWQNNNLKITIFMNVSLVNLDVTQLEINSSKLDNGDFTSWSGWTFKSEWKQICPFFYNFTGNNGYAYQFRLRANTTTIPVWRPYIYAKNILSEINITLIDTTDVTIGKVNSLKTSNNNTKLNVTLMNWYDVESDIKRFQYQITNKTDIVQDWTIHEGNISDLVEDDISFGDGVYYLNISAQNGAGSWSDIVMSGPIIIYNNTPKCKIHYFDDWQNDNLEIILIIDIYGDFIDSIQLEVNSSEIKNKEFVEWSDWEQQKEWNGLNSIYYNYFAEQNHAYKFRIRANNLIVSDWSHWCYAINPNKEINTTKIDTTKAEKGLVTSLPITNDNTKLNVELTNWFDENSDIVNFQYQITNQTDAVIDWTIYNGNVSNIVDNSRIFGDGIYYFNVSAQNGAGLWSDISISNPIKLFTKLPVCEIEYLDGWENTKLNFTILPKVKGEYIYNIQLEVNRTLEKGNFNLWSEWTVLEEWKIKAPAYYFYDKGKNGFSYQFRIRANNSISNKYGKWSSDVKKIATINIDISKPMKGNFETPSMTNNGTMLSGKISGFSDPESGIAEYRYKIMDKIGNEVRGWTKTNTTLNALGLSLENGGSFFIHIRARNGAGNWSEIVTSNMINYTQLPDLTFISVSDFYFKKGTEYLPETEIRVGESLIIVVNVHNIGKGDAREIGININLIGEETIPIGHDIIEFIAFNNSTSIEIPWNITDIINNTYTIKIQIDDSNLIVEEDENNNQIEKSILIKPKIIIQKEEKSYFWVTLLFVLLIGGCIGEYIFISYKKSIVVYDSSVIEDVFMLYKDGRLILHETRRLRPEVDEDVIGSMLTAVQEFVGDAFDVEESGTFGVEYGSLQILYNGGKYIIITAILSGNPPEGMREKIDETVKLIEEKYEDVLENWDGVVGTLSKTKNIIRENIIAGKSENTKKIKLFNKE